MIHPSAIVDPSARLARDVEVGPGAIIGADVEIGDSTSVGAHVIINGPTSIGRRNRIFQFNSIGDRAQDKKYAGEHSRLEIGDDNVIREFCTINRGTDPGGGVTRIGDRNWIMAYVHVAHDCRVGSDTVMANGATLAGHVRVEDHVTLGAFTLVHQFCAIGAHSFSAMGTVVLKDVPPFVTVSGNSARPHGLNREGLRRHGFDVAVIRELRQAYKTVFRRGLSTAEALAELERSSPSEPVCRLCEFIQRSERGIVR